MKNFSGYANKPGAKADEGKNLSVGDAPHLSEVQLRRIPHSERFLRDAFSRMTEVSRGAINGARIGGAVNPQRPRKPRLYFTPT